MNSKPLTAASVFMALVAASIFMSMTYFAAPTLAQAAASTQTADFVRKASIGNIFEIESSKLAVARTSAKEVKNFALMMMADHTQLGDQLKKTLASSDTGLSVAEKPDDQLQKTLDSLKAAPTTAFDNLYVQAQSKAHDDAVSLFADYADSGDNMDLKNFASSAIPTLKKHQELVHSLTQSHMISRQ